MNEILTWLLDAVQGVDPVLRTVIAGVAIMLETSVLIGLVVPGDTVVIVSATAVDGPLEFIGLIVAVVTGAVIGESIGFALGRVFGPRIRASRLGRRIGEANWIRAENYLARRGGIAVFISRFLPVLHSIIPLTVGMSAMKYRTFIAWTVPACIVWSVAYVSVASAAAGTYRELADKLHFAGYVFVGIIVVFLLLAWIAKKVLNRVESRHMVEPGDEPGSTPGTTRAAGEHPDA